MKSMIRSYSELILIPTFIERYRYLKLDGIVGEETFGYNRFLNQTLYNSTEWKNIRRRIFIRDNGYDLGVSDPNFEILGTMIVHHINPINYDDIINRAPKIFDPENLITTRGITHRAIHFGDESLLFLGPIERSPGDTTLW